MPASRWRTYDLGTLIAELESRPGEIATVRLDRITAGALVRRHVRAAFNQARIRGAQVEEHEERGLLDSVFAASMRGKACQLAPALRSLAAIGD